MPGEEGPAFALAKISPHAGCEHRLFHQRGDMPIIETLGADLAAAADGTEDRAVRDPADFSQFCSATTGQVRSLEPRPISISRQPVLPRTG